MKKIPLLIVMLLISLVLISGLINSSKYYDVHGRYGPMLSQHPVHLSKDLSYGKPSFTYGNLAFPKDEQIFLADNIKKSNEMVERLQATVERLKNEGNDVQELDKMVEYYALLVSEAKDYLSKSDASTSLSDEQKYLELSREKIILANSELKDIFAKTQIYLPGPVSISGNDILTVYGRGILILSGDLDIALSLSTGEFSVIDFAGDMDIDTAELYSSEGMSAKVISSGDPGNPQKMLSYVGVQGNVTLSSSELTVAIMGEDIGLLVRGTGEAEFYGNGTYYLQNATVNKEGTWISPIF
ncbi:hypothetical protein [Methanolobus psychrotolerans]|uniref:hypothetical protein n=1 Tax=Methanolobus psychrotolerans TaxID=1874706 RepID=UPI000B91881F|nr:hypothetical protein [Methanolobus psychrotolerans]